MKTTLKIDNVVAFEYNGKNRIGKIEKLADCGRILLELVQPEVDSRSGRKERSTTHKWFQFDGITGLQCIGNVVDCRKILDDTGKVVMTVHMDDITEFPLPVGYTARQW